MKKIIGYVLIIALIVIWFLILYYEYGAIGLLYPLIVLAISIPITLFLIWLIK